MTSLSRARRAIVATIAVVTLLGATACSGDSPKKKKASSTSSSPAPTTSASSSKPKAAPAPKNPLTGVGAVPKTPVIAVKMDDTPPGRPQVGIDKSDVAYIEAVEGGLTRLAVIFGTHKPTVGYVRSTRPSDPDLLLQYGKITEAYSGGQRVSLNIRKRAGLTGWSNDGGAAYFQRVSRSESTYINLTLNLAKVAKKTKTNRPKSNGWTFNPSLAGLPATPGTSVRTVVTGSYGSGTPVSFKWDPKLKKYIRYIDGVRQHAADGNAIGGTNVIVQSCKVVSYNADKDVNGNPAQFTYTVGSGKVAVFRNGKRIDGTWSRSKTSAGTTLRTTAGKVLPLNPGNTWVVLIRKGIAVHG
jgi:hypothetical protein